MLIVIEGLDGAGKSTQVKKLKEYIVEKGYDLEYLHFPRYEAPVYGDLIGEFLRGGFGDLNQVHPKLVALLYALDRQDAAASLRKALKAGKTVLLDRYEYSNIAYQCAKLPDAEQAEALRKWIIDTEFGQFGEPRPDINIFLDVPLCFVKESLSREREGADRDYLQQNKDIHEADIEFQKRVRDFYRLQASEDPTLLVVDCSDEFGEMLSPDDIFAKIKALVDERL